jgi:hypothetical protein
MKLDLFNADIWDTLSSKKDDDFTVRHEPIELEGSSTDFACIFISVDNSFNLLISPALNEKERLVNISSNGLKLSNLHNWLVVGRLRQTYIHLKCEKVHYVESFTKLIKEILTLISIDLVLPTSAVNLVVRSWDVYDNLKAGHRNH